MAGPAAMNAVVLSLCACAATIAGGFFALRFSARLPLALGFTAGALLGVVSFELIPEAFAMSLRSGTDGRAAMVALVAGFLLFLALHERVRALAAGAMVAHSLMDGVGIGLAFQVSPAMGAAVALAVIAHDFCDGLNTTAIMIVQGSSGAGALAMLALDAFAPVAGVASAAWLEVPPHALGYVLGFFAGFLLYVGIADILPRARRVAAACPGRLIALSGLGASLPYLAVRFAG
jgi:ZIP family zinc transporter